MANELQPVTDWLHSNTNKAIRIAKEEQEDIDRVDLQLSQFEYREYQPDAPDDYTNGSALLLYGEGTVLNNGSEEALPQETFVIPLEGLSVADLSEDSVVLKTERAIYSLTLR
ncbi:hypothetical protein ACI48J_10915 [Paenibacillus chitinolyticus]|uniref:hypothetical protein n=1 Tax=Paenibacillus chitinolyticus TaxID=79263 RepID=UPI002DBDF44E|nr:hypothetical protein [Paenibacillus chitinolyticus]MEC0246847.1 hypothetical protein [Paenibacillus chitinolyticus]